MSDTESNDSTTGQRLHQVKVVLKGADNYTTWERRIGSTLMGLDLLSAIQVPRANPLQALFEKVPNATANSSDKPTKEEPDKVEPIKFPSLRKRQKAWDIIYSSLSDNIISRLSLNAGDRNIADSHCLWKELKASYGVSTMQEFARRLNVIFSTAIPENKDPMPYLSQINAAFTECAQSGHLAMDDRLLAAAMLKALPASYRIICQSEYAKPTLVSTTVASSIRVKWERQASSGSGNLSNVSAGLIAPSRPPQQSQQRQGGHPDPATYCPIHKSTSHLLSQCNVALQVFKPTEGAQPQGPTPRVNIAAITADNTTYIASALRTGPPIFSRDGYYVDSGATEHIVSSNYRFIEKRPCVRSISTADEKSHLTTHMGKVRVTDGLILDNVLLVPTLKCNLISVNRLFAAGFDVRFSQDQVNVYHNEQLLAQAPFVDGLYTLTASYHPPLSAHLAESTDHLLYWHRRLGHRSFREVVRLGSEGLLGSDWRNVTVEELSNASCPSCIIGKGRRLPHHPRPDREPSPNDLVHIDIWGPAQTQSPSGSRYFLTCYDDHTKHVRLYPLKTKDQALPRFAEYIKLVENQCSTKIKRVRMDNGGQFSSSAFQKLLSDHGIIPNFVPPDAHAQNGWVERAHLTILNSVRTLLADTELPPSFWLEAASYSVHVMNRLPDLLTRNVPYTMWSGRSVDPSHLYPFGAPCYVRNHMQKNKLGPRYFQALLMGWQEDSEHVIRYYDPAAWVFNYSRDVVFQPPSDGQVGAQPVMPDVNPNMQIDTVPNYTPAVPTPDSTLTPDFSASSRHRRSDTLPVAPATPSQSTRPLTLPETPARPGPRSVTLPPQPPVGPFERTQPAQAVTESSQTPLSYPESLPSSPISPLATQTYRDLIRSDRPLGPGGELGNEAENNNEEDDTISISTWSDHSQDPLALLAAGLRLAEFQSTPMALLVNGLEHAELNPTTYRQARNSGQWEHWKAAMDDKLAKMEQYKVFQVIPRT